MMILTDSSLPLDLNNLLDQIGEEVASEWYQLGRAVGISEEMLDECSNRSPQGPLLRSWTTGLGIITPPGKMYLKC